MDDKKKKVVRSSKGKAATKKVVPTIDPDEEKSHFNKKFTDKELEEALIESNGRPTKAATMLGVSYAAVHLRIRSNPKLKAVQIAYKSRTHTDMVDMAMRIAVFGLIREPKTDEDGNVFDGEFVDRKVDYGTRTNVILKLADMYKGEDGTIDTINLVSDGSGVNVSEWLNKMEEERRNKTE